MLGAKAFERLQGMLRIGDHDRRLARAPDFYDGWWGYVSKDLRSLFGPKPRALTAAIYCGGGSQEKCRAMLQRSLAAALKVTPEQLYGGGNGDCAANPQPACFDQNRPKVTGGIEFGPRSRSRTGRPSSRW